MVVIYAPGKTAFRPGAPNYPKGARRRGTGHSPAERNNMEEPVKEFKKPSFVQGAAILGIAGLLVKIIGAVYRILRDGVEIARAESASQYPHEEDAAEHKIAAAIPAEGFFRVWTREQNLDLLFVTLLAFARSSALDDRGGSYGAIRGTLKRRKTD